LVYYGGRKALDEIGASADSAQGGSDQLGRMDSGGECSARNRRRVSLEEVSGHLEEIFEDFTETRPL